MKALILSILIVAGVFWLCVLVHQNGYENGKTEAGISCEERIAHEVRRRGQALEFSELRYGSYTVVDIVEKGSTNSLAIVQYDDHPTYPSVLFVHLPAELSVKNHRFALHPPSYGGRDPIWSLL